MKILILGANGLLGHNLFLKLNQLKSNNIIGICGKSVLGSTFYLKYRNSIRVLDLSKKQLLKKLIIDIKPDFVINCVVKKNSPENEKNYHDFIFLNSILPHLIADLAVNYSFKFIHISSDCVLGNNFHFATELNPYKATDLYSATKLISEVSNSKNVMTLRTSIFGHTLDGNGGFLDWSIKNQNINGFDNCFYTGTTAFELSNIIHRILKSPVFYHGTFHISSRKISKYMILKKINKIYNLNNNIKRDSKIKINRELNSVKFNKIFNYKSPSWNELILATKNFYLKNKDIYARN